MNETMDSGLRSDHESAGQEAEGAAAPERAAGAADANAEPRSTEAAGQVAAAARASADEGTTADESAGAAPSSTEVAASAEESVGVSHRPWTGGCGCDGSQLVYFIGEIGFDYGTEARRDAFQEAMASRLSAESAADLLKHLRANKTSSQSVIWTLAWEGIPVYAYAPGGAYASEGFDFIRRALTDQLAGKVERVSVPGVIKGKVRLRSGQKVPVILPDPRGLNAWQVDDFVKDVKKHSAERPNTDQKKAVEQAQNFLRRVFYELRSVGTSAEQRAINFAATMGFTTHDIFAKAIEEGMELEKIAVEDTPICRPRSICRDVLLTFFDPRARFERARQIFRLTVDVSDTVPATIGPVRRWSVY